MNSQPIGFFDSGVGLLSVLLETKKLLPKENFVIFADQVHNPFGHKSKSQIKNYSNFATSYLSEKHKIKMMVLACNTATVLALNDLRKNFNIPIVGTVPAIKPAYEKSKNLKIAVLSTPATAKSAYLSSLIQNFAKGAKVKKIGASGLEEAIEILDFIKIDRLLKNYLNDVQKFKADVVVLGCTHYPLVKDRIKKFLDTKTLLIDSGQAISVRIKNLLEENNNLSENKKKDFFYTTGNPKLFSEIASYLLKYEVIAQKVTI